MFGNRDKPRTIIGAIILLARSIASASRQLRRIADVSERYAREQGWRALPSADGHAGERIDPRSTIPESDEDIALRQFQEAGHTFDESVFDQLRDRINEELR